MRRLVAVPLLVTVVAFGGCGGGDGGDTVLVLAASSLTEAFEEIGALAEAEHLDVEFSFAGSQVLVEQVDQGAPADVIAVADPALLGRDAQSFVFAHNRLVAVTPRGSPIATVEDLAADGVRVVLATETAPVGKYAREALAELGLLETVLANVVSEEPDVKSVLAKVALGEADGGIVYATDARADDRVHVVGEPLPGATTYAAMVVEGAPHAGAATRVVALLASAAAQRILERFGFTPP